LVNAVVEKSTAMQREQSVCDEHLF